MNIRKLLLIIFIFSAIVLFVGLVFVIFGEAIGTNSAMKFVNGHKELYGDPFNIILMKNISNIHEAGIILLLIGSIGVILAPIGIYMNRYVEKIYQGVLYLGVLAVPFTIISFLTFISDIRIAEFSLNAIIAIVLLFFGVIGSIGFIIFRCEKKREDKINEQN